MKIFPGNPRRCIGRHVHLLYDFCWGDRNIASLQMGQQDNKGMVLPKANLLGLWVYHGCLQESKSLKSTHTLSLQRG